VALAEATSSRDEPMKPSDPETQPKTHDAAKKGDVAPPGQPELKEAPLDEPYGKKSGSRPPRVPGERAPSPDATRRR
jgi:hypothetical protein